MNKEIRRSIRPSLRVRRVRFAEGIGISLPYPCVPCNASGVGLFGVREAWMPPPRVVPAGGRSIWPHAHGAKANAITIAPSYQVTRA